MRRTFSTAAAKAAVVALSLAPIFFLALPVPSGNADSCLHNSQGTLSGPFNVGGKGGFDIRQSKLVIANCHAIFHWQASARASSCAGLPFDRGPWLSFTPIDENGGATQSEVRVALISVPNAVDSFDHDHDVTDDIKAETIERATHIKLSIEEFACNH
jgi:hypothetical protein